MNTSVLRRTGALAAVSATLVLGLAACGSDSSKDAGSTPSAPSDAMTADAMQGMSGMAGGAADTTFGAGCSQVPTSGAGSFDAMATVPVATAASANPLLSTLVTAVGKAGLVDTLNKGAGWTVFAPTNDAFAKLPTADLDSLLKDKKALTAVLTHHVIEGQLSPDQLAGTHKTVNGDEVKVTGSGENFTVDGKAMVICGNVQTANATVYIIDSVLTPQP